MPELFDKHGGFRRLHSFTLATIVQLETLRFCRRFITQDPRESGAKFYDPKGRQYDQMTQAARSGRQNIIEGSERSAMSKDTEMKLTDVARASLSELRGDYEIWILDRGQLPWSVHSPEANSLNAISLDPAPFTDDMVHESAKHALEQRKKYARWLDADDAVIVANAMLIVIGRALNMLKSQIETQGMAPRAKGRQTDAWDELDEAGNLAAPGSYRWRGLFHQGIDPVCEASYGTAGIPPWDTADNTALPHPISSRAGTAGAVVAYKKAK